MNPRHSDGTDAASASLTDHPGAGPALASRARRRVLQVFGAAGLALALPGLAGPAFGQDRNKDKGSA